MSPRNSLLAQAGVDPWQLDEHLAQHGRVHRPRLEHLWSYYRNPMRNAPRGEEGRAYRLAQEAGLPVRILGTRSGIRREVVVENDIAWRIQAMIDFMLPRPVRFIADGDKALSKRIESALEQTWEASGGLTLMHEAALLGHVFGHVDLLLRIDASAMRAASLLKEDEAIAAAAQAMRIEAIDPRRGVALMHASDARTIAAYAIHADTGPAPSASETRRDSALGWLRDRIWGAPDSANPDQGLLEVITPNEWLIFHQGELLWQRGPSDCGGELPVVHIQNTPEPFAYAGVGEVEPLIPLQDELNTRLSDRACRVTMQSFKMYMAKGVEGFSDMPIGPGTLLTTSNPDAEIIAFGGDADSPSETRHIRELRDALDKASGVPPIASGVVQAKIGNLSSANALRITLMGVLSKTARKRIAYGAGIARLSALILAALDHYAILRTTPAQRRVRIDWPDPLPVDEREQAQVAESKARLGAPRDELLRGLGVGNADPGVQ